MKKEREGKILEAIGRQREDIIAYMDSRFSAIRNDLTTVSSDLAAVKGDLTTVRSELDSVKKAVIENGSKLDNLSNHVKRVGSNHEQRITNLEQKVNL